MQQVKRGKFNYLVFKKLTAFPQIVQGVFLRPHDISSREEILQSWSLKSLAMGKQVHGKQITTVVKSQEKFPLFPETDGLLTNEPGVGLYISHADCQATLLFDPKNNVIGAVHSGWRGSVQNIYANAIQKMQSKYGSLPEDIIVCIGPSLGPLAAEFKHYQEELPKPFHPYQIKKTYFDFWAISEKQLLDLGIRQANIEIARMCTFSNPTYFYSYRRGESGRHGTFIGLTLQE